MSFEWGTIIVIGSIFALFFYAAARADKAVEAKAKAARESKHQDANKK